MPACTTKCSVRVAAVAFDKLVQDPSYPPYIVRYLAESPMPLCNRLAASNAGLRKTAPRRWLPLNLVEGGHRHFHPPPVALGWRKTSPSQTTTTVPRQRPDPSLLPRISPVCDANGRVLPAARQVSDLAPTLHRLRAAVYRVTVAIQTWNTDRPSAAIPKSPPPSWRTSLPR
jgi:hypothetical protein